MSEVCPVCLSPVNPGDATCPKCNFHLSGATQAFRPLGADGASSNAQPSVRPSRLRMVRGPQVGATYRIGEEPLTIGRNPQCDIFLNDMTVSRSHANITVQGSAHVINDEHSFNGVWVNNHTVDHHALRPGDYIQIGKYDFVYEDVPEEEDDVR